MSSCVHRLSCVTPKQQTPAPTRCVYVIGVPARYASSDEKVYVPPALLMSDESTPACHSVAPVRQTCLVPMGRVRTSDASSCVSVRAPSYCAPPDENAFSTTMACAVLVGVSV